MKHCTTFTLICYVIISKEYFTWVKLKVALQVYLLSGSFVKMVRLRVDCTVSEGKGNILKHKEGN
uniref:Uncharacterized protein n=1 Tax=Arundo donax TaxID=35708 RepID=A0A0A9B0I5_ARUDO